MNEILSPQNAKFKVWSSLLEARGIKKNARALVAGKKLVAEFLEQNPAHAEELLVSLKDEGISVPKHVKTYSLATPLFKELDVMGTKAPQIGRASCRERV